MTSNHEELLILSDLSLRTWDRTLVDGVSVTVRRGRITAVVGASGSGKTVSARAAMGVLDVDPGLVRGGLVFPKLSTRDWFSGVHGKGMPAQRRLLAETAPLRGGYVTYSPQSASSALNPGRTVGRQLEIAIRRRAEAPDDMGKAIRRVLDEVGLPPRAAYALPGELSGGMAQRVAVAVAVAPNPSVLIADEPETGLDPVLRRVITELMIEVAREHDVGLMLITHNMDTVSRIADEIVKVGAAHG